MLSPMIAAPVAARITHGNDRRPKCERAAPASNTVSPGTGNPAFSSKEGSTVRRARAKVYENWGSDELVRGNVASARSLLARSMRDRASLRAFILLSKALLGRV